MCLWRDGEDQLAACKIADDVERGSWQPAHCTGSRTNCMLQKQGNYALL